MNHPLDQYDKEALLLTYGIDSPAPLYRDPRVIAVLDALEQAERSRDAWEAEALLRAQNCAQADAQIAREAESRRAFGEQSRRRCQELIQERDAALARVRLLQGGDS